MTHVRPRQRRRAGRENQHRESTRFLRHRAAAAAAAGLLAAAALAGPVLASPAQAAVTPQYKLTIIGSAGTELFGINKNGTVFGIAPENGARAQEGFLLAAGSSKMVFLGSPGDLKNVNSISGPEAINSAADVVGEATSVTTGNTTAVEWPDSSTPTDLGTLPAIANTVVSPMATSINDNGLITVFGSDGHGDAGFTIQGTTVTRLPALPNGGVDVQPLAVNGTGLIVGKADTTTTDPQAVEWQNGAITALGGLPGSLTSEAVAVNSSGEAVGTSLQISDSDGHAVLFANGTVTDLNAPGTGTPGGDSSANAINDNGVIVGQGGNGDAFVYSNGQATDLNTLIAAGSGFTLRSANGINDNGVIVGTATSNSNPGQTFGFELTPITG
jgi:probable HAF family extracellular repeat protein